ASFKSLIILSFRSTVAWRRQKFAAFTIWLQKFFTVGTPKHISRSRCPMGLPTARQLYVETYRWRSLELHKHPRALGLASSPNGIRTGADIAKLRPVQPVTLLRPHAARRAARFFVEKFPGRSLYAVKANPSPVLLSILWK